MISKIKRWWALLWRKEEKIAPIGVPYRIPTLDEVEQTKAAEQARREREFTANVQQGVAAICERLHKGETRFIVSHGMCDGKEVVLYCYYTSERYM